MPVEAGVQMGSMKKEVFYGGGERFAAVGVGEMNDRD